MSKVVFPDEVIIEFSKLNENIKMLNEQKILLLLKTLGIVLNADDCKKILAWELIAVSVPDRQLAVQLNKMSAYIPNLKFIVNTAEFSFTLCQGTKGRRVWKER